MVRVPTIVGCLRPVILLPASVVTGLPASHLDAVLAHELAHVRRHDYLVNVLQSLVETLLFYHPAVWWCSRQIRIEREHCCDDLVVEACGDRVVYAHALAQLEELRGLQTDAVSERNRRAAGRSGPPRAWGTAGERGPLDDMDDCHRAHAVVAAIVVTPVLTMADANGLPSRFRPPPLYRYHHRPRATAASCSAATYAADTGGA